MKRFKTTIFIILMVVGMVNTGFSQEKEVSIKLSDSKKTGTLSINVIDSPITIEGYDGDEVKVSIIDNRRKTAETRAQDVSLFFTFIEEDNKVFVHKQNRRTKNIDLKVLVPFNFSLQLKTTYGDYVKVKDVTGNIEIDAHKGDIDIQNSAGSAILYSANGDITAEFTSLSLEYPSAISNVYGDIALKLPGEIETTVNIDSYSKEFSSEFNMTLDPSFSSKNETVRTIISSKLGFARLTKEDLMNEELNEAMKSMNEAIMTLIDDFLENRGTYMTINGGGSLVRLKNHRGKIGLKKLVR